MPDEDSTAQAADLAERIVDEVSRADRDWHAVERWARELAAVAARAARPVSGG